MKRPIFPVIWLCLLWACLAQNIVLARQVAMYLAREMTDNSLPKIGKEFGGRDHSTVLHAYNKIKNMIAQDDSLRIEIDTIKNKIK